MKKVKSFELMGNKIIWNKWWATVDNKSGGIAKATVLGYGIYAEVCKIENLVEKVKGYDAYLLTSKEEIPKDITGIFFKYLGQSQFELFINIPIPDADLTVRFRPDTMLANCDFFNACYVTDLNLPFHPLVAKCIKSNEDYAAMTHRMAKTKHNSGKFEVVVAGNLVSTSHENLVEYKALLDEVFNNLIQLKENIASVRAYYQGKLVGKSDAELSVWLEGF